jgi:hypothetical protein
MVYLNIAIYWDIAQHNLYVNRCFRGTITSIFKIENQLRKKPSCRRCLVRCNFSYISDGCSFLMLVLYSVYTKCQSVQPSHIYNHQRSQQLNSMLFLITLLAKKRYKCDEFQFPLFVLIRSD